MPDSISIFLNEHHVSMCHVKCRDPTEIVTVFSSYDISEQNSFLNKKICKMELIGWFDIAVISCERQIVPSWRQKHVVREEMSLQEGTDL